MDTNDLLEGIDEVFRQYRMGMEEQAHTVHADLNAMGL